MRNAYARAEAGEPGLAGYDRWFAAEGGAGPNNASLASIGIYTEQVPAFRALRAREGGDQPRFYDRAQELAALPKADRGAATRARAGALAITRA